MVQLEDLGGRRIDLGPPGSGSRATVMRLVESAGIDPEAFLSLASPTSALSADTLCRGISDAFASVGASPNSVVQEALTACPTRLVPVAGPIVEPFLAGEADYRAAEIGPADYRQLDRPVATVRTPALLVADAGLPDETAYRLTATVLGRLSELRRLHLAFTGIEAAGLLAGCPPAPYHPGALAAFADAGLALPPCL